MKGGKRGREVEGEKRGKRGGRREMGGGGSTCTCMLLMVGEEGLEEVREGA